MSSSKQDVSSDNDQENNCVVCCKPVEIYSVGVCDHPVCFECSTRMRVLCQQNECPICRGQMPQVIFTTELGLFSALYPKLKHSELQDRKYGLIFASPATRRAYQQLLEFRCQICTSNSAKKYGYTGFQQLKDHMRREHGLHYCELCVNNLKIFAFERKCYTKQQLGYHRRKGDPDNTSHRGHPLCEFCDTRFVDSDELLRHLRREHLFCHYCDADGKNQYYSAMEDLRRHFGEEHYLCEEGECKNMPLTAVFRTEIDLKAHVATEHSRFMSKSATKQARTLELEFTLAPRPRPDRNKRVGGGGVGGGGGGGGGGPGGSSSRNDEEGAVGYALEAVEEPKQLTAQDFPALGNSSSGTLTLQSRPTSSINFTSKVNPFSREEFPTLGGARTSSNVTITTNSTALRKKPPEVTITRTVRGERPENLTKNKENFPRLGGSSAGTSTVHLSVNNGKITAPKVSIHVNHNSNGAITTTTHITTNAPTSSSSTTNTSSNNNNNNNSRSDVINSQRKIESFPALGNSSSSGSSSSSKTSSSNAPVQQPQWVQQKSKKTEQKQSNKVAPPPQLPPSDLSQFPSLSKSASNSNNNGSKSAGESGKKAKKSSSVSVPVMSNNWVANNNNNNNNNNNSSNNNNNKKNKDAGSSSKSGSNDSSKSGSTSSSSNGSSKDKETYLKNADSVDTSKSKNVKKQKKKNPSNNNGTTNNQDTSALSNTQLDVAATTDSANNKTNSNTNSNVVDGDVVSNKPSTITTGVDNTKNGLTVKKRSELNIGSLTLTDATTTLGNNVEQSAKPPPGFPAKPPPGLTNLSAFPALVKDLTFTNSSGQSYSIQPDSTSSKTYHQPSNFNARNQNLFKRFTDLIDNEQIREFKAYSALFREGRMPAREYYLHCKAVLDAANFDEMFLELLVLLPDIDKQQELYRVYEGALKKNLLVCESCKQVIFKRELSEHYNYHLLENQFPSLTTKDGGSVGEAPSSAWNRRNK